MKKKSLIITVSAITLVCIAALSLLITMIVRNGKKKVFEPLGDSMFYAYQVESADIEGDYVVIKGWYFELRKIRNSEIAFYTENPPGVIIYDMSRETKSYAEGSGMEREGLAAEVIFTDRPDINDYFKCEYDYTHCGFEAKIKKSKIDFENGKYQVLIKPDEMESRSIQAAFILNGQLRYTSPLDEMMLNVQGTDLEKIVKDGVCVLSNPDAHVCVYQYGWKLYWITDSGFVFEKDGTTQIEFCSETTQFDRLLNRRKNNIGYLDDMGDLFENYEVTDTMDCGEYRVAVREIPDEYAVTQLVTGYKSKGKWVWRGFFRPVYRFLK